MTEVTAPVPCGCSCHYSVHTKHIAPCCGAPPARPSSMVQILEMMSTEQWGHGAPKDRTPSGLGALDEVTADTSKAPMPRPEDLSARDRMQVHLDHGFDLYEDSTITAGTIAESRITADVGVTIDLTGAEPIRANSHFCRWDGDILTVCNCAQTASHAVADTLISIDPVDHGGWEDR